MGDQDRGVTMTRQISPRHTHTHTVGILLCCPSLNTSLGMIISISLLHEKPSLAVWNSHMEENKGLATAPAERPVPGATSS